MEKKPHLSDEICYQEEIAPHRFIALYAGVGSGKNTFINHIINGDKDGIPKKTVLLITSRRAKVNEILNDEDITAVGKVGRWGNLHKELKETDDPALYKDNIRVVRDVYGTHRVYQQSVVCTNAFIENYFKYCYDPLDATTHLWELFDLIVVDEVHSLLLDATYQSAPYYVKRLIEEVLDLHAEADKNKYAYRPLCERVILMTGTPAALNHLNFKNYKPVVVDKRDSCRNVMPQNVHFLTTEESKTQIAQQIERGERGVYFANHIITPDSFDKEQRIPKEKIVASFSKKEKRKTLKLADEKAYDNMESVEAMLANGGVIPKEFSLLLTTAKNKEGINIEDESVQHVYVETHNISDIQQMAGRVRHGAEHLYIISDARQFIDFDWEVDDRFSRFAIVKEEKIGEAPPIGDDLAANRYLKKLCEKRNVQLYADELSSVVHYSSERLEIVPFISYIHEKFPFVRYDYLKNVFCYYKLKTTGIFFQMQQTLIFDFKLQRNNGYMEMMHEIFPVAKIHPYKSKEGEILHYIEALLKENPMRKFTLEEEATYLADLNALWSSNPKKHYPKIGTFLKKVGYKRVRVSKDSSRPSYNEFRYIKE